MHGTDTLNTATRSTVDLSDEQRAYKVKEVAQLISVTERYVWHLVGTGVLPSLKIGNSRRILRSDLDAYLDSLRADEQQAREYARTHPPSGPHTPPPPSGPRVPAPSQAA
ncbi:helix-turn-helix domain-containing protein [Catenuloplanes sp. NPDC051500]|uniref:helix-turn-helix domain-containing protein n=1 Tax=Catenuloplanes sp. NPDC051500 TaxID=3363959 RepID=UPI0037B46F50